MRKRQHKKRMKKWRGARGREYKCLRYYSIGRTTYTTMETRSGIPITTSSTWDGKPLRKSQSSYVFLDEMDNFKIADHGDIMPVSIPRSTRFSEVYSTPTFKTHEEYHEFMKKYDNMNWSALDLHEAMKTPTSTPSTSN